MVLGRELVWLFCALPLARNFPVCFWGCLAAMNYEMRLPGYGGAAVLLRRAITLDPDGSKAVDIWLLGPDFCNAVLCRPSEPDFLEKLARHLFAVAVASAPEQDLASFADVTAGLTIDVGTSDSVRVGLRVRVIDDPDAEVADLLDLDFETSRAALVATAQNFAETIGGMDLADFEGLD